MTLPFNKATAGVFNIGTGSAVNATPDAVAIACQTGSSSIVNCFFLPKVNINTYIGAVTFQYNILD